MSLLFVVGAYAQRMVTVQGVVTDATFKEPVIGANIVVKGTTLGTICDVDGKYVLENVPADGTLVFSFIGMKTVEVKSMVRLQLMLSFLMMFKSWKM